MASRKAIGPVIGFFKLWKIFGCLKGKGNEVLAEERVKMMGKKGNGWSLGHRGRVTLQKVGTLGSSGL